MATDFSALLDGLRDLGAGYGKASVERVRDPDLKKLADSYRAGLSAATAGMQRLGDAFHQALPADRRAEVDRLAGASGMIEMLARANQILAEDPFTAASGVTAAAHWFEKVHRLIRELAQPPGAPGDATGPGGELVRLIPGIERLLENLGRLLRQQHDCEVDVFSSVINFTSQGLNINDNHFDIMAQVNDTISRPDHKWKETDAINAGPRYLVTRRGLCGEDIEIRYVLSATLLDDIPGFTNLRAQKDESRTYHCPYRKDHEPFTLRADQPDGFSFFEFKVDFRVELTCVDGAPR